jgi:hypothetical protein
MLVIKELKNDTAGGLILGKFGLFVRRQGRIGGIQQPFAILMNGFSKAGGSSSRHGRRRRIRQDGGRRPVFWFALGNDLITFNGFDILRAPFLLECGVVLADMNKLIKMRGELTMSLGNSTTMFIHAMYRSLPFLIIQ